MIGLLISGPIVLAVFIGIALAMGSAALADRARPHGDPGAGEVVYERCAACHSLGHDRAGPRHCGLFGRRAGSMKDFEYSDAMRRSQIVWTEESLDRFLAAPLEAVPGTSMGYSGIADPKERSDLIAYLKQAGGSAVCGKRAP
jgi:cytochrome c